MWFSELETTIDALKIVQAKTLRDSRGEFARLYCASELSELVENKPILQVNRSVTHKLGSVRGLHFQRAPFAEIKIVRCIRGRIWDVAVDLRATSPTFLKWHAEELSAVNQKMMVIPEGFAHGFQVLDRDSELIYFHTQFYQPDYEEGLRVDDSKLAIDWPLAFTDISERDMSFPLIGEKFSGF